MRKNDSITGTILKVKEEKFYGERFMITSINVGRDPYVPLNQDPSGIPILKSVGVHDVCE